MNRKRLIIGGTLAVAIVVASTSVAWSKPVLPDGSTFSPAPASATGIAGPLGPQQISPVAAYFKRVTYTADELGQSQDISAKLPAGRYLVEVLTPHAAISPDCLGVSFPLVPPNGQAAAFTGYVTVAQSGDPVTIACFQPASTTDSAASYELTFIPTTR